MHIPSTTIPISISHSARSSDNDNQPARPLLTPASPLAVAVSQHGSIGARANFALLGLRACPPRPPRIRNQTEDEVPAHLVEIFVMDDFPSADTRTQHTPWPANWRAASMPDAASLQSAESANHGSAAGNAPATSSSGNATTSPSTCSVTASLSTAAPDM